MEANNNNNINLDNCKHGQKLVLRNGSVVTYDGVISFVNSVKHKHRYAFDDMYTVDVFNNGLYYPAYPNCGQTFIGYDVVEVMPIDNGVKPKFVTSEQASVYLYTYKQGCSQGIVIPFSVRGMTVYTGYQQCISSPVYDCSEIIEKQASHIELFGRKFIVHKNKNECISKYETALPRDVIEKLEESEKPKCKCPNCGHDI